MVVIYCVWETESFKRGRTNREFMMVRKFEVCENCIWEWSKKKDLFLQTCGHQWAFWEQEAKPPEVEKKVSSYLNERWHFNYVV